MYERQIELEREMGRLGYDMYMSRNEKTALSNTKPGKKFINMHIEGVTHLINEWRQDISKGKAKHSITISKLVDSLEAETIAFIALKICINSVSRATTGQEAADTIGKCLECEITYRRFKQNDPKAFEYAMERVKPSTNARYIRRSLIHSANRVDTYNYRWSPKDQQRLGYRFMEMCITATGLFYLDTLYVHGRATRTLLLATPTLIDWLKQSNHKCALLSPVWFPMVSKPLPWTNIYDGGYYTTKVPLVKSRNHAYLGKLNNTDLSQVLSAVNGLQNSAWKINTQVLKVAEECWKLGGGLAGMPKADGEEIPPKPIDIDTNLEARKEWSRKKAATLRENQRLISKIVKTSQQLQIASRFSGGEELYFPYQLDWRGRAYPIPNFVNPQSDDLGKALLCFHQGKPLGSEGWKWLAIHLANSFGVDKVSFQERIKWTLEHSDLICDSALNPLDGKRFWLENKDDPWIFLAACFEWLGYCIQGEDYVSHINVQLDGAANGLQNFSAMLRDEVGGIATALVPSDKPSDIYSLVVDRAVVLLREDLEDEDKSKLASFWLTRLNRGLTKRNTMTMPYGVTLYGMKDQLIEEIEDQISSGKLSWDETIKKFEACSYLASIMKQSIGQTVVAAKEAMDWLREAARVASENGLPITWTTPVGFFVQQDYRKSIANSLNVWFMGKRQQVTLSAKGEKMDKRKQVQGLAPNFVHSMDAAHMMRTVNKCLEEGITEFAFIHDSYGTHAAEVGTMAYLLRDAFIEQYTLPVLEDFRETLIDQLGRDSELAKRIPELPPRGNLNLEDVRDSDYFFC